MFQKPLVATDFGNQTDILYNLVLHLFSESKPTLHLVTVIEHEEFLPNAMRNQPGVAASVPVQPVMNIETEDVEREIESYLDEARQFFENAGFHVNPILQYGVASECILDAAQQHDCDCILLGSHGYRKIMDVLIGTTADNVLKFSRVPVLLAYKGNTEPRKRRFFEM
jgi:nucleotide-binding universal stress UspA family protein